MCSCLVVVVGRTEWVNISVDSCCSNTRIGCCSLSCMKVLDKTNILKMSSWSLWNHNGHFNDIKSLQGNFIPFITSSMIEKWHGNEGRQWLGMDMNRGNWGSWAAPWHLGNQDTPKGIIIKTKKVISNNAACLWSMYFIYTSSHPGRRYIFVSSSETYFPAYTFA